MIDVAKVCVENPDGSMTLTLHPDEIAFVLIADYTGDILSRGMKDGGLTVAQVIDLLSGTAQSFSLGLGKPV